jgi:hypothetical protein
LHLVGYIFIHIISFPPPKGRVVCSTRTCSDHDGALKQKGKSVSVSTAPVIMRPLSISLSLTIVLRERLNGSWNVGLGFAPVYMLSFVVNWFDS